MYRLLCSMTKLKEHSREICKCNGLDECGCRDSMDYQLCMLQGAPQKILQSQIREHGVSLENIENKENTEKMEKMENINQMTLTMIQNITLLLRKKLNLSTRSSTLFYGIFLRRSKNHGEHESGSDQNWRISSNCCAQYK